MYYNNFRNLDQNQLSKELERKKKQEYQLILKQQIEEKKLQKEKAKQKEIEEELKFENKFKQQLLEQNQNYPQKALSNNQIKKIDPNKESPDNFFFNQNKQSQNFYYNTGNNLNINKSNTYQNNYNNYMNRGNNNINCGISNEYNNMNVPMQPQNNYVDQQNQNMHQMPMMNNMNMQSQNDMHQNMNYIGGAMNNLKLSSNYDNYENYDLAMNQQHPMYRQLSIGQNQNPSLYSNTLNAFDANNNLNLNNINNSNSQNLYSISNNINSNTVNNFNQPQLANNNYINNYSTTTSSNIRQVNPMINEDILMNFVKEQMDIIQEYENKVESYNNNSNEQQLFNALMNEKTAAIEKMKTGQENLTNYLGFYPMQPDFNNKITNLLDMILENKIEKIQKLNQNQPNQHQLMNQNYMSGSIALSNTGNYDVPVDNMNLIQKKHERNTSAQSKAYTQNNYFKNYDLVGSNDLEEMSKGYNTNMNMNYNVNISSKKKLNETNKALSNKNLTSVNTVSNFTYNKPKDEGIISNNNYIISNDIVGKINLEGCYYRSKYEDLKASIMNFDDVNPEFKNSMAGFSKFVTDKTDKSQVKNMTSSKANDNMSFNLYKTWNDLNEQQENNKQVNNTEEGDKELEGHHHYEIVDSDLLLSRDIQNNDKVNLNNVKPIASSNANLRSMKNIDNNITYMSNQSSMINNTTNVNVSTLNPSNNMMTNKNEIENDDTNFNIEMNPNMVSKNSFMKSNDMKKVNESNNDLINYSVKNSYSNNNKKSIKDSFSKINNDNNCNDMLSKHFESAKAMKINTDDKDKSLLFNPNSNNQQDNIKVVSLARSNKNMQNSIINQSISNNNFGGMYMGSQCNESCNMMTSKNERDKYYNNNDATVDILNDDNLFKEDDDNYNIQQNSIDEEQNQKQNEHIVDDDEDKVQNKISAQLEKKESDVVNFEQIDKIKESVNKEELQNKENNEDEIEEDYGNDFENANDDKDLDKIQNTIDENSNKINLEDYQEIRESQKFQTQLNFFEDSGIENISIQKSKQHIVKPLGTSEVNQSSSVMGSKSILKDKGNNSIMNSNSISKNNVMNSMATSVNPMNDSFGDNLINDLDRYRKMALGESNY